MITQTSIHAYYSVLLTEGTSVLWIAITVLDLYTYISTPIKMLQIKEIYQIKK